MRGNVVMRQHYVYVYIYIYIYLGPTNALVYNKTSIQMSRTKTLKITPTYFDHQMIVIREIFYPG
jgi:hypothetical protein